MQITRRHALLGATAVAATIPSALLAITDPDTALHAALAEFHRANGAFLSELDQRGEIHDRVRAQFPELDRPLPAYGALDAERRSHAEDFNVALKEAGYEEETAHRLCDVTSDAFELAAAIPARSLAGLGAKLEALIDWVPGAADALEEDTAEQSYGPNLKASDWQSLVADIRRLAGEVSL